jgi:hypothetical protein
LRRWVCCQGSKAYCVTINRSLIISLSATTLFAMHAPFKGAYLCLKAR